MPVIMIKVKLRYFESYFLFFVVSNSLVSPGTKLIIYTVVVPGYMLLSFMFNFCKLSYTLCYMGELLHVIVNAR